MFRFYYPVPQKLLYLDFALIYLFSCFMDSLHEGNMFTKKEFNFNLKQNTMIKLIRNYKYLLKNVPHPLPECMMSMLNRYIGHKSENIMQLLYSCMQCMCMKPFTCTEVC